VSPQQLGTVLKAPHLTIHSLPGSKTVVLYCGNCTGALHLALPTPAQEFSAAIEQFVGRHHACKEK
jgi:hypothetical protein